MRKIVSTTTQTIVTYSQNHEDIILASFFPNVEHGYYVDIGAAHPDYLSVTKYFYTKGWHGVNVEPNERLFGLITHARPRDLSFRAAISNSTEKKAVFREYLGDGLSTLSKKIQQSYEKNESAVLKYNRDYEVPVRTLGDVLKESKLPEIHFMKVDVEGFEYEVLESNDWVAYRPHILCIEANHVDKDWHKLLEKNSYSRLFHDGLNDYYADIKFYKELPAINYNFIYSPQIISTSWDQKIEELQRQIREQDDEIKEIREELANRLTAEDGKGIRFKALVKILFKKIDAFITGKIIPARESDTIIIPKQTIAYTDTRSYDQEVWNSISAHATAVSPPLARRIVFAGYKTAKKALKKAAKTVKGSK